MQEIKILIKDLTTQKAQIELERMQKITKEKIIDIVAMLIKDEPNDNEYQKKLIETSFIRCLYMMTALLHI